MFWQKMKATHCYIKSAERRKQKTSPCTDSFSYWILPSTVANSQQLIALLAYSLLTVLLSLTFQRLVGYVIRSRAASFLFHRHNQPTYLMYQFQPFWLKKARLPLPKRLRSYNSSKVVSWLLVQIVKRIDYIVRSRTPEQLEET